MTFLKEQYAQLRRFWRGGYARYVLWCGLGLLAAGVVGFVIGLFNPELIGQVVELFMQQVEEAGVIDAETGDLSPFGLLMNNWMAMLLSAAYGFIPFLFLPGVSILSNGVLLGLMAALYHQTEGFSLLLFLAGLLPHGVFELPALTLSVACGMYLCRNMCRLVVSSPKRIPMVELLGDLLRVLVLVVFPLTAASAFIEAYVTPVVMGLFL